MAFLAGAATSDRVAVEAERALVAAVARVPALALALDRVVDAVVGARVGELVAVDVRTLAFLAAHSADRIAVEAGLAPATIRDEKR